MPSKHDVAEMATCRSESGRVDGRPEPLVLVALSILMKGEKLTITPTCNTPETLTRVEGVAILLMMMMMMMTRQLRFPARIQVRTDAPASEALSRLCFYREATIVPTSRRHPP